MDTTTTFRLEPNPGPQTEFARSPADIVVYGGGAGGGKTYAIVTDPILQGYYENSNFRAGIFRRTYLRYFVRENDQLYWGGSKQELIDQFPDYDEIDILSVSFIPALLDDNPALLQKDPAYRGKLRAQPRIERERLEKGNWKIAEGAIIEKSWIRRYVMAGDVTQLHYRGQLLNIEQSSFRRFSTTDTAGTSKENAREKMGDPASWSVTAIWDFWRHRDREKNFDVLVLRHVWRDRVGWNELKARVPEVIRNWNVPLAVIENAHFGQPLSMEMQGVNTRLVGPTIPGMGDSSRGAKLERAIASGLLSRLEDIGIWIPEDDAAPWVRSYMAELTGWTGLPKETADQIDASSYACYHVKSLSQEWGGAESSRWTSTGTMLG